MIRVILVLGIVVLAFSNVARAQQLNYDAEIANVDRQIAEAEEEAAKYSGGLILSMIKMRIETLRYSKAMIEQSRREAARDRGGFFSRLWAGKPSQEQTPTEVGLMCGHKDYGFVIVVRPMEKKAAISTGSLRSYSETDDEIVLPAVDGISPECHLNRYTLGLECPSSSAGEKPWKEKCEVAGLAKIPDRGRFWLRCGAPGRPNADQSFKLSINEDSSVEGGYVVWKDSGRRCTLNRYNGHISCDPRPTDWDVSDKPTCQVLSRGF
jgi:hypothetical protein